jgi:hypothetical protein
MNCDSSFKCGSLETFVAKMSKTVHEKRTQSPSKPFNLAHHTSSE